MPLRRGWVRRAGPIDLNKHSLQPAENFGDCMRGLSSPLRWLWKAGPLIHYHAKQAKRVRYSITNLVELGRVYDEVETVVDVRRHRGQLALHLRPLWSDRELLFRAQK